jgi:hypothetical protein
MLDRGTSYRDLKRAIEAHSAFGGLFGEYRAELIARAETAMAANAGATDLYAGHGLTSFYVIDNPECPVCAPVAGTLQSLAWCRANPIGHPNCVRSFRPPTAAEVAQLRSPE